jgi:hypothetical protein
MLHYCKSGVGLMPWFFEIRFWKYWLRSWSFDNNQIRSFSAWHSDNKKWPSSSDNVGRGQRLTACFCHRSSRWSVRDRKGRGCIHVYAHRRPFLHTSVPGHDIPQEDLIACTSCENFRLRTQPLLLVKLGSQSYLITQKCGLPVDHSHNHMHAARSPVILVAMVH